MDTAVGEAAGAARAVHYDNFVFDFVPPGEPMIMTARHDATMRRGLDKSAPTAEISKAMALDRLDELRADPATRDTVRKVWAEAGVNAVGVTLGCIAMDTAGWDQVLWDAAYWQARVRAGGDMEICTGADALEAAARAGKIGLLLGLQDSAAIGKELDRLDILYNLGLRVLQLTYNNRNLVGDGCTERDPGGLSRFGAEFVKRLNKMGVIVDISHCGPKTSLDTIAISERPVAVTHAGCRVLSDHPRCKTDDVLRAVRDGDGYFGVVMLPLFLDVKGGANLDTMIRHIAHAAGIVGPERVGIGSDWGSWSPDFPLELLLSMHEMMLAHGFRKADLPTGHMCLPEVPRFQEWPRLTAGLMAHGFSAAETRGIIGGNWLRYMRRAGL